MGQMGQMETKRTSGPYVPFDPFVSFILSLTEPQPWEYPMGDMGFGRERSHHASPPALELLENKRLPRTAKVLIASGLVGAAVFAGSNVSIDDGFSKETYIAHSLPDVAVAAQGLSVRGGALPKEEITVVTLNTASGSDKITTPQPAFLKLPFYQKAINGDPDAPIIGLQEVGPAQAEKVAELAKKSGNFSYSYINSRASNDGNLLIVPKRFEVLKSESSPYPLEAQVKGMVHSLGTGKLKLKDMGQLYPRMWSEMRVKDRVTGEVFTVGDTHLSYNPEIQRHQLDIVSERMEEAQKYGPVLYVGDFNADTRSKEYHGKNLLAKMEKAGMTDMSPQGRMNIDYVWASGFKSVGKEVLISPPGIKSDHDGEKVIMRMDTND